MKIKSLIFCLFIIKFSTFFVLALFGAVMAGCKSKNSDAVELRNENLGYYEFEDYAYKPKLVLQEGLFVEVQDSLLNHDFDKDNEIFTEFKNFNYSYIYVKEQDTLYFRIKKKWNNQTSELEYDWDFVKKGNEDDSTIVTIQLSPDFNSKIFGNNYVQTVIRYDYLNARSKIVAGGETTGCVENYKNTWVHPPRSFLFKILQLNPFPFIQAPYKAGKNWTGSLVVGDYWSDVRWLNWDGLIENKFSYTITDKKQISTPVGNLNCYLIEGIAKSKLGTTYLNAYFHMGEGFIQVEYQNIDGSRIFFKRKWI